MNYTRTPTGGMRYSNEKVHMYMYIRMQIYVLQLLVPSEIYS